MTEPLICVRNLCVDYPAQQVVKNISFTTGQERLALVGESGSGKSMTARALMGLVRKPGIVGADTLTFGQTSCCLCGKNGGQHCAAMTLP